MCLLHDWGRWTTTEEGEIHKPGPGGTPVPTGSYLIQSRTCNQCGKTQLRTERTS